MVSPVEDDIAGMGQDSQVNISSRSVDCSSPPSSIETPS